MYYSHSIVDAWERNVLVQCSLCIHALEQYSVRDNYSYSAILRFSTVHTRTMVPHFALVIFWVRALVLGVRRAARLLLPVVSGGAKYLS